MNAMNYGTNSTTTSNSVGSDSHEKLQVIPNEPFATSRASSDDQVESFHGNDTTDGCCNDRFRNFLYNARTFFSHLWDHKAELGLGLLNITGGLVCIFFVDLPTFFGSETITNGLPFFMLGAGATLIGSAFIKATAETRKSNHDSESDIEDGASQNGSGRHGGGSLITAELPPLQDSDQYPLDNPSPGSQGVQSPSGSKDKALA